MTPYIACIFIGVAVALLLWEACEEWDSQPIEGDECND